MNKRGILAIISGFSGAGKGTVVNKLLEKDNYAVSISATTREPRQGEVDGKNYFFKSRDEFEVLWKQYFQTMEIKPRHNERCQNNLCPKWYRSTMIEFAKDA